MNQYMSLKDHVYNYISERINDGSLMPEEKINEQIICADLQISRTPVREALIQLASEGYLENLPRRGFKVKQIDEKKAIELYRIIGALDSLAGSLAVDFVTNTELSRMKDLIDDMDKAIIDMQVELYYKLQAEFHAVYMDVCHNEELTRLLSQLKRSFIKQTYTSKNSEDLFYVLQRTNDEHKVILQLFEAKDRKKLEMYIKDVHWNIENAKFDSL